MPAYIIFYCCNKIDTLKSFPHHLLNYFGLFILNHILKIFKVPEHVVILAANFSKDHSTLKEAHSLLYNIYLIEETPDHQF